MAEEAQFLAVPFKIKKGSQNARGHGAYPRLRRAFFCFLFFRA
jgi:hypothetical protein